MESEKSVRSAGLLKKAAATIRRESLLRPGDTVLVALSGGADSMALLHALLLLREPLGLSAVEAAHVNHGLRAGEADRDEAFVRETCRRLNVPLSVLRADVRAEAAARGEGLEEAGRRVRYAYFAGLAAEKGAITATAHTLSDSMETVLLHMARGCGLRGLCGIPASRPLADGLRLVRPLLGCTRAEVEAFCTEQKIAFVTDSTNAEDVYARNRIRRQAVPALQAVNPGAADAFARLMKRARQDEDYLAEQAAAALADAAFPDEAGEWDAVRLRTLPPALKARALTKIAGGAGILPAEAQVEGMERLLETGGAFSLSRSRKIVVSQGRLAVVSAGDEAALGENNAASAEIPVEPGISFVFSGRITMPRVLSLAEYEKELKIHKNLLKNALNYDKISGYVSVRSRRPGDSYHPAGRDVGKTLKKLLNEAGLPAWRRNAVPVFCDREGIVLVGGFGCDERVRIDADTRRVLLLEPEELKTAADGKTEVYGGGNRPPEGTG